MSFKQSRALQSSLKCCLFGVVVTLTACSSSPTSSTGGGYPDPNAGRYSQDKDSIPMRRPTEQEMQDPEVNIEPLSPGGNKPYNIYGINYSPRLDILEYNEEGTASWYGNKFHGHLTSNGETYNVFAMTAAHKTLPLPSYVQVTNLANGKTAVVRVNDRGPFHDDRIMDLSYAAAVKLGIFPGGTGRVRVELLASPAMANQDVMTGSLQRPDTFDMKSSVNNAPSRLSASEPLPSTGVQRPAEFDFGPQTTQPIATTRPTPAPTRPAVTASSASGNCFVQLVASSDQAKVQRLGNEVTQQWSVPTKVESANGLFRLLAGPLQAAKAAQLLEQVKAVAYPNAYIQNKKNCG